MRILGIETSCDETGVAVFEAGRGITAEALSSQINLHAEYGGVVPELASRDHIAQLAPLLGQVLGEAGTDLKGLDGIAYTAGPGLIGALLVGGTLAASLAYALGTPVIPVHHMEGHLLACMLEDSAPDFPFLALLVSGGHTQLVRVAGVGRYETLGQTLDDAAGEAFDKVARLLSLPYPGGPALAKLAELGDRQRFGFPRPLKRRGLQFSFSGLKTAVRIAVEAEAPLTDALRADVAASFQAAVVDTLVEKCARGIEESGLARLVVAGGVGANHALRAALTARGASDGFDVYYPRPALCTDNGAMIAYAGWCRRADGQRGATCIIARPRWALDQLVPPADAGIH